MASGLDQVIKIIKHYGYEKERNKRPPGCECSEGYLCQNCRLEKVGELIEEHPIVSPKRR